MTQHYIEFKKKREIGEVLSDTFTFLRQNFKLLFTLIFKIAGPAFLILLVAAAFYIHSTAGLMDPESLRNGSSLMNAGGLFLSAILMMIAFVLFYSMQLGTVLHYIKSYIQNKGVVNHEDVKQGVKSNLGGLIGLGIASFLIILIGLFFCVIPGIYLYVPMTITFTIMVFNQKGISDAISESFKLVKDEWWTTFLTLFVLGIIVGLVSTVFQIPVLIYSMMKGFTMATESSLADPSAMIDWVFIALSLLSSAIQYLLYTVVLIGVAFIYFNLNERKNFTGTFEQIESLGKTE